MALREHTPGLPDYYNGKRSIDPLPITKHNVDERLVGWMTVRELARAMNIATSQGENVLYEFLDEHHYTQRTVVGVVQWSKFSGRVCGQ